MMHGHNLPVLFVYARTSLHPALAYTCAVIPSTYGHNNAAIFRAYMVARFLASPATFALCKRAALAVLKIVLLAQRYAALSGGSLLATFDKRVPLQTFNRSQRASG